MKKIYTGMLLLVFTCISKNTWAGIDVYMKVTDASGVQINGESVSINFQNWIELKSLAEEVNAQISIGSAGGGAGVGKAVLEALKFDMPFNSASIPILSNIFKGTRFRTVDIWFVKTGSSQTCNCAFYKIHMEDVFLSSLQSVSDDATVNQQLSFKPVKIAWAYYKQSNSGTYPSTPTNKFGWNMSTYAEFVYSF